MFSKRKMPFSHQRVPSVPLTPRPFSPSITTSSSSSQTSVEIYTIQPTPESSPPTSHRSLSPDSTRPHDSQCRWSDVVPPNSGLTFAVVWDPEDEMVAFSGAELFQDGSQLSPCSSDSPTDAVSQILTIPFSENTGNYTGTLQYFRENHEWLFNDYEEDGGRDRFRIRSRWSRLKLGRTQASSTMGEMDVYLRGSLMGVAHPDNTKFNSCFGGLDGKFEFDPRMDFEEMWAKIISTETESGKVRKDKNDIDDEGFFEVEFVTKRHPNTTETPSSGSRTAPSYPSPDDQEDPCEEEQDDLSWQTIECPDQVHRLSIAYFNMLHPNEARHPKLLKKRRRPSDAPCHPAEVLQREVFSHQVSLEPELPPPPPPSGSPPKEPFSPIGKLCRTLSVKWNKGLPLERWVCVEVVEDKEKTAGC
ncbi:hypothetical protein L218DRAFT_381732 [Marasmius fiardii PR-910]|nr:hypothetical protein L218DRAFT_381732 [Marasmius fiardii PR-910]